MYRPVAPPGGVPLLEAEALGGHRSLNNVIYNIKKWKPTAHPKLCLILASVWMKSPARKS